MARELIRSGHPPGRLLGWAGQPLRPSGLKDYGERLKAIVVSRADSPLQARGLLDRPQARALPLINGLVAWLTPDEIASLLADPEIEYVELDGIGHLLESDLGGQPWAEEYGWGTLHIGADDAHVKQIFGTNVKIGIIDTGIDYRHNDLKDNYAGGIDIADEDEDPLDWHGHGTHCSGIAAARDNGSGMMGVAPRAKLYAVKVFPNGITECSWSDVILALQWCVEHGIQIASMSIGGEYSYALLQACQAAWNAGLILVAAAGNSGGAVMYPAAFDSVIAVGAINIINERPSWSCYGPSLELVAPGQSVKSCLLNNTYGYRTGTSMSCPHVSGTAALLWSANRTLTNQQVRQILADTAQDLGATGRDNYFGYGLVRADLALADYEGEEPEPEAPEEPEEPEEPEVIELQVVPHECEVRKGVPVQLHAKAIRSDESWTYCTSEADWECSSNYVNLLGPGYLYAAGIGQAVVTATYAGKSDVGIVQVLEPTIASVSIMAGPSDLVVGQSWHLKLGVWYEDESYKEAGRIASWASSQPEVATVVAGHVTALAAGQVTIQATLESHSASWPITVLAGWPGRPLYCEYVTSIYGNDSCNLLRIALDWQDGPVPSQAYVQSADESYLYGHMVIQDGYLTMSQLTDQPPNGQVRLVTSDDQTITLTCPTRPSPV